MNLVGQHKPIKRKNQMHAMIRWLTRSIMPAILLSLATVAAAHEQHGGYSAGEPGNPNKPAREIVVDMTEMDFSPALIEVKRGEQIRFVIRNLGTEDHEFLLATTAENLKHADAMKKHPGMEHDDPNGVRLAPKKSAEILW